MAERLNAETAKKLNIGDRVRFVGGGVLAGGKYGRPLQAPQIGAICTVVDVTARGVPFIKLPCGTEWYLGRMDCGEFEAVSAQAAFFIVWNPANPQTPRYRHPSEASARRESERLAREHPHQRFYVLRTVSSAIAEQQITMHTEDSAA